MPKKKPGGINGQISKHPAYSVQKQRAIERATAKYPKLPVRASLMADFIESYCVFSKGGKIGRPFRLIPWQFDSLAGMYPGMPDEERIITRVLISMARKQGKTEFCSAVGLGHLCGPESGKGEELICAAAANKDQAGLVWDGAKKMAQANVAINRFMTYRENRIIWKLNSVNNYMKTISTKPSSAQGLLPSWWSYDEIAEATVRDLYDALHYGEIDVVDDEPETGEVKIAGSMGMIISTRSNMPNSLFAEIHDDAVLGQQVGRNKNWFVQVFSADAGAKRLYTFEQVKKANPSMGYTISEGKLRQDLENAIANVSSRPGFKSRRLNLEAGNKAALVDPESWDRIAKPESFESIWDRMKGERVTMGLDLGSTTSLTSLAIYFPDHKFVTVVSWMANTQVQKNETIHKVPYSAWAEEGHLRVIAADDDGGMTYQPIAEFVRDCIERFDVKAFRYDGWNSARLFDALVPLGLRQDQHPLKKILDRFIPGMKEYGEAVTEFLDLVLNERLSHDDNPVTRMGVNVCQVEVKNRGSDEVKIPEKNKQQLPNDPAVAMLMSIANRGLVLPEKSRLTFAERVAAARERAAQRQGVKR